jgi:nucleotide-binding universal stress UspA family protein
MTMQHILIPTDFSQHAWNATSYALQFFKSVNTTFHFLHIETPNDLSKNPLHCDDLISTKIIPEKKILKMKEWMQKVSTYDTSVNHNFKQESVKSFFVEAIKTYIIKHSIDLLVMGSKGCYCLTGKTIGSKTAKVITRVKCPVFIIPEKAVFKKPIHIGFLTDFNMVYKNKVMQTLLEVSQTYKSSINVLRVAGAKKILEDSQNNNRELLKDQLKEVSHSFHVIENPNLETAVQSFVDVMQIDMIAMIAKNLNLFQRLLFKPKGPQKNHPMQVPFLVLHE